jgi:Tfp pilus assembly protein PilO
MKLPSLLKSMPSIDSIEKIDLKPSTMLIGLGGIILVAYVVIGFSYLKGRQEQTSLREQIEAGGGTLSSVSGSQQTLKDVQERLAQAQGELTSLENALPQELNSASLVEGLLAYAAQSNVWIRQMNALPPKTVKAPGQEEGSGYTVMGYNLAVDGALPDLLAFVSRIEGDITQTVAVGDLGLALVEEGQEMKLVVSFYAKPDGAEATASAAGAPQPTPNGGEQP